jgi:hypothetical protein
MNEQELLEKIVEARGEMSTVVTVPETHDSFFERRFKMASLAQMEQKYKWMVKTDCDFYDCSYHAIDEKTLDRVNDEAITKYIEDGTVPSGESWCPDFTSSLSSIDIKPCKK